MSMVKIKTAELIGAQLDWAVAKAEQPDRDAHINEHGVTMVFAEQIKSSGFLKYVSFQPSFAWQQGGPIIERERIELQPILPNKWRALIWPGSYPADASITVAMGESPLTAAMRAFVACKLGDEVEVPA